MPLTLPPGRVKKYNIRCEPWQRSNLCFLLPTGTAPGSLPPMDQVLCKKCALLLLTQNRPGQHCSRPIPS
jgi:hypothetical protein